MELLILTPANIGQFMGGVQEKMGERSRDSDVPVSIVQNYYNVSPSIPPSISNIR